MKSTHTPGTRSTAQRRRVKAAADVRDLIRRDHETLLDLLNQLCASRASPAARTRALQQLAYAAPAHDKPEERAVYSALRKASEKSADIAYEGKIEHGLVSELLAKLERAKDIGSPRATAQAKVLKELLEHHIEEEHSEMFERLGKDFNAEERTALGAAFLAAKQAYARQHPVRRRAAERAAAKRASSRAAV
jgi:hemerythrin-like domain-containing protein